MQTRFSQADNRSEGLAWCRVLVHWPVERVVSELEVVAPKEATLLERVVGRVLEEFSENTPDVQEVSRRLGVVDPIFVQETLQEMVQLGAVEPIDGTQALDMKHYRLTELGRGLLREGQAPSLPQRHGLHVYRDAVTDEHLLKKPARTVPKPDAPVLRLDQLPGRTTELGLDTARQLASAQQEPFMKAYYHILSVRVKPEAGRYLWVPMAISLAIGRDGLLHARLEGATQAQKEWFENADLRIPPLAWLDKTNGEAGTQYPATAIEVWLDRVDHLMAPSEVNHRARSLVNEAGGEVVLHAHWWANDELRKDLASARERGIRCYVCGVQQQTIEWSEGLDRAPGFVLCGGHPEVNLPVALISDLHAGMCIDRLSVRTPAARALQIEVGSRLRRLRMDAVRNQLLDALKQTVVATDDRTAYALSAMSMDVPAPGVREQVRASADYRPAMRARRALRTQ